MDPGEFLAGGPVSISAETYAVCRADQGHPAAFATIQDDSETTVVVDEADLDSVDAGTVEGGWKRLTFEMELPFELVGFLASVATALAEADVAVFVLSTYSTDHVFVNADDIDATIGKLETLGCQVTRSEKAG